MRLFRFEFSRLLRRDLAYLVTLIIMLVLIALTVTVFLSSEGLTVSEKAKVEGSLKRAESETEEKIQNCLQAEYSRTLDEIYRDLRQRGIPEQDSRRFAASAHEAQSQLPPPSRAMCLEGLRIQSRNVNEALQEGEVNRFVYWSTMLEGFTFLTFPLLLATVLISASYAGIEWNTGSITTLLTWVPGRVRLFLTKSAVLILVIVSSFLALLALLALALLPAGIAKGTFIGFDKFLLEEFLGIAWRLVTIVCVFGLFAFALATLLRNTGATLGVLAGYFIVVENLIGALAETIRPWLVMPNLALALSSRPSRQIPGRTPEEAVALLVSYAAVLTIVAMLAFWRRGVAGQSG